MSRAEKHIVLATHGSLGDLHPMLALGLELQRRGHRATIATAEAYRAKVQEAGLAFHAMAPNHKPDDPQLFERALDLRTGPEYLIRELLMPHVEAMYEDLTRIAPNIDCLLAGEIAYAAPLVAQNFGLPWAAVTLSPLSFFSAYDPSVIPQLPLSRYLHSAPTRLHELLFQLGKFKTRDWGRQVNELRHKLGLPGFAHPLFEGKYSPCLNLALFSGVLAAPQPDWPLQTVQTGFVFYDRHKHGSLQENIGTQAHSRRSLEQLKKFMMDGEPPVLFTLGSAAVMDAGDFYDTSAEAARLLGKRAVLLMGGNPAPANLPSTIAVSDYAPFSEVLPLAACVVHQGGVGTSAQALQAGIPQLVMPYAFDQPDNAARLERLGVAKTIPRKRYSAPRAARLIKRLLEDGGYAAKARAVREKLKREDGLALACSLIETRLLKNRMDAAGMLHG